MTNLWLPIIGRVLEATQHIDAPQRTFIHVDIMMTNLGKWAACLIAWRCLTGFSQHLLVTGFKFQSISTCLNQFGRYVLILWSTSKNCLQLVHKFGGSCVASCISHILQVCIVQVFSRLYHMQVCFYFVTSNILETLLHRRNPIVTPRGLWGDIEQWLDMGLTIVCELGQGALDGRFER